MHDRPLSTNSTQRQTMPAVIAATGFAVWLLASPTAHAFDEEPDCRVVAAEATASFGVLSSFVAASSRQITSAQPGAGLRCPRSPLSETAPGDRVLVLLSSASQGHLKNVAGDLIPYEIFADSARQEPLTIGIAYDYTGGVTGDANDMPMYFAIAPVINPAAGRYVDTLIATWEWQICRPSGLDPCARKIQGTATTQIRLELEIQPDCVIHAPDLNFGAAPFVRNFSPVTQTIHIRCTRGQTYSAGLDDGQHAVSGQRRMAANGRYLAYDIFQDPGGTLRWGKHGNERRESAQADSGAANHDGLTGQGFVYTAIIDPDQTTPLPGTYADRIIVDVEF